MARSLNQVQLIGNVVRDCEVAFTPSGASVGKFAVATNRRWKDKNTQEWVEEAQFTNCVYWQSEKVAPYITKGKQIHVLGRLQTRSYDGKDGNKVYATEVIVEDVILLGGKSEGGESQDEAPRSAPRPRTLDEVSDAHEGV